MSRKLKTLGKELNQMDDIYDSEQVIKINDLIIMLRKMEKE